MTVTNVTRMEARSEVTEGILNITLEIIHLLTGEDYTVVKKTSEECLSPSSCPCGSKEWSRTQRPIIVEPPPQSITQEKNSDQKILKLANEIIKLLTGEVPIRCQDVAVYFSMEEWEYIEGHKDLYKDVIMDGHHPLTSPGYLYDNASLYEQVSCVSSQPNHSSCSHLRNKLKNTGKYVAEASCDEGSLKYNSNYRPTNQAQYPVTYIMEECISCNGGTITDTNIYTPTDDTGQCPSSHIMEEPVSCNGRTITDTNVYTPTDDTGQGLSSHSMEEPISCNGGTITDTNIYTPTDDTGQGLSSHSMEEPISCNGGTITDTNIYTPTDDTGQGPSSHSMEEPISCNGGTVTETNVYTPTDDTGQYPSSYIMEEAVSCDEENCTDPDINTYTDNTQYQSSHIREEPLSCHADLADTNSYTQHDLTTHIKEEPLSCDEDLPEPNSYPPTYNTQDPTAHIKEEPLSCDEDLPEPNSYIPTDHLQYTTSHIMEQPANCDDPTWYTPTYEHAYIKNEEDSDNEGDITHPNIYTTRDHAQYPVSYDGGNIPYPNGYSPYHVQRYPTTHIKEEPVSSNVRDFTDHNRHPSPNQSTHIKEEPGPITSQLGYLKETDLYTTIGHTQNFPSTCVKDEIAVQHSPTVGCTDVKTEESPLPVKVIVLAHLVDVDHTKPGSANNKYDHSQGQKCVASPMNHVKHDFKDTRSSLRNHSSSAGTPEAGQTFGDISNLTKYSRTHSRKKIPQCSECGQYFLRKFQLDAHLRTHTKQRYFQCSDCGIHFLDNVELLHRKQGPGPTYQCPVCRKRVDDKPNLVNHEKNHKGEKPFQCPECGKCFSIYYQLYVHKKTHTED